MEVVGLVLGIVGVLPVITEVIKSYRTIVEVAQVKQYMSDLEQDLKTEEVILHNTYERLLGGIVQAGDLESMSTIEPRTLRWQEYDRQIRIRLEGSFDVFKKGAQDIQDAVVELQQKLAINDEGKTDLTSWPSIKSAIKLRTRFTLKKKDYTDSMNKIRYGNDVLKRLLQHNIYIAPTRLAQSKAKLARRVRRLTNGLFHAIKGAITCKCGSHDLGLQLAQIQNPKLVGEWGNDTGREFCFDIVLERKQQGQSPIWEGLHILCNEQDPDATMSNAMSDDSVDLPVSMQTSSSYKGNLNLQLRNSVKYTTSHLRSFWTKSRNQNDMEMSRLRSQQSQKRVRFSSASSQGMEGAHTSNVVTHDDQPLPAVRGRPPPITDICYMLQKGKAIPQCCIGSITNKQVGTQFDVYHRDSQLLAPRSITLREVLLGRNIGLRDFDVTEITRIALVLSFGVLHLCNTPWLNQTLTLDDIIFLCEDQASECYEFSPGRPCPFLASKLPATNHTSSSGEMSSSSRRPVNFLLLSLGMLLTHIIAGRPIEEIEFEEHMSKESLYIRRSLALKQFTACEYASEEYFEVVEWCLHNSFTYATLEDKELSQDFHDAVISRLQRILGHLLSPGP